MYTTRQVFEVKLTEKKYQQIVITKLQCDVIA